MDKTDPEIWKTLYPMFDLKDVLTDELQQTSFINTYKIIKNKIDEHSYERRIDWFRDIPSVAWIDESHG